VEFLLMRAMSLKLVTGSIDEIDSVVDIRHLQPRVLTMSEIEGLQSNVEGWISKVDSAAVLLDKEGIGAVEALA
jgi:26S proteasome regulatory subunit N9